MPSSCVFERTSFHPVGGLSKGLNKKKGCSHPRRFWPIAIRTICIHQSKFIRGSSRQGADLRSTREESLRLADLADFQRKRSKNGEELFKNSEQRILCSVWFSGYASKIKPNEDHSVSSSFLLPKTSLFMPPKHKNHFHTRGLLRCFLPPFFAPKNHHVSKSPFDQNSTGLLSPDVRPPTQTQCSLGKIPTDNAVFGFPKRTTKEF